MGESNRNTTKVQSSLPMGGNERGRQTEIPSFHPDMPDMNDPLDDDEDISYHGIFAWHMSELPKFNFDPQNLLQKFNFDPQK